MPLPQRSASRTVRIPRFMRSTDAVRPANFGPGPQLLPPESPGSPSLASSPADGADAEGQPLITMPSEGTTEQVGAEGSVPDELLEGGATEPALDAGSDVEDGEPEGSLESEDDNVADDSESNESETPSLELLNQRVDEAMEEMTAAAKADALALGLAVAHRLVGLYIDADEGALRKLIDEAFRRLAVARKLELHLHPSDLELLTADGVPPLSPHSTDATLRLVSDDDLSRGEVVVMSELGEIDGTLEARIDTARAVLESIE